MHRLWSKLQAAKIQIYRAVHSCRSNPGERKETQSPRDRLARPLGLLTCVRAGCKSEVAHTLASAGSVCCKRAATIALCIIHAYAIHHSRLVASVARRFGARALVRPYVALIRRCGRWGTCFQHCRCRDFYSLECLQFDILSKCTEIIVKLKFYLSWWKVRVGLWC